MEIVLKEKDVVADVDYSNVFIGHVTFTIADIPMRVTPDSPLEPKWYKLEDQNRVKLDQGELMVSVRNGSQAYESFPDAWHSDARAEGKYKFIAKDFIEAVKMHVI